MRRHSSHGWPLPALVAALLVAVGGCTTGGDEEASATPTAGPSPSTSASDGPAAPDVCALLDAAVLERLVPGHTTSLETEESSQEVGGRCTVDNGQVADEFRGLVARVTTWPDFDTSTMLDALADRCADISVPPSAVGSGSGCSGVVGDAAEAHLLQDTTIVSVAYQIAAGDEVPGSDVADLEQLAADVLAGA